MGSISRRDGATRRRRTSSARGRWPLAVVLSAGIGIAPLLAGCGGQQDAAPAPEDEVLLQPATARGPHPYTASTARELSAPAPEPLVADKGTGGSPLRRQTVRTVSGETPGLYGGIEAIGSCDAERQAALLRDDRAASEAFARGAGVSRAALTGFLRGLTPVVLRTDTRVTAHGYREGADVAHQAVLQAGTAVLVDRHGAPRVRCAGGTPLRAPVAAKRPVALKGSAWAGYSPDRVVVIRPAERIIGSLTIVDVIDSTWIDRRTGSDGEQDKRPDVLPPVDPDDVYVYPRAQAESADDADGTDDPGDADDAAGADSGSGTGAAPSAPSAAPLDDASGAVSAGSDDALDGFPDALPDTFSGDFPGDLPDDLPNGDGLGADPFGGEDPDTGPDLGAAPADPGGPSAEEDASVE